MRAIRPGVPGISTIDACLSPAKTRDAAGNATGAHAVAGRRLGSGIIAGLVPMNLFPRFTNRRRALQLGWYTLRHGTRVLEKLNRKTIFLSKMFANVEIDCNVCGQRSRLWYEMLSAKEAAEHKVGLLRETLECLNCLSRMRYRLMAHGMLEDCRQRFGTSSLSIAELAAQARHVEILDTDAFSPIASIMASSPGYKVSSYVPDRPFGLLDDNRTYNVNLEAMGFPEQSFDMILSSDVMEHVRDFDRANREIFRCLKPGGAHIFTVPFADPMPSTRTLIDTGTAADLYLQPPQYHGDDHLSVRIPAYRIYGWDLLDALRALGFESSAVLVEASKNGIYGERYFIARRPA